jgi:photosystem II stability/assembly factor-like uncharacterized protein
MRKLNLLLFIGVFLLGFAHQSFSQEAWTNLSLGTGDPLKHFTNITFAGTGRDTTFAVARNRAIWRSTDTGLTWTKVHDQTVDGKTTNDFLWGIAFIDRFTGFASGGRSEGSTAQPVLLKTTDGGSTWTDISAQLPAQILEWGGGSNAQCLYGIKVVSSTTFYIYGKAGAVVKANFNGTDWIFYGISLGDYGDFRGLAFAGTTAFAAADTRKLQKRSDINETNEAWTQVDHGGGNTYDVEFFDANNGLCVTISGGIYKTTDGGVTWTAKTSGIAAHLVCWAYSCTTRV